MRQHKRSPVTVEVLGDGSKIIIYRHLWPDREYLNPTRHSLLRLLNLLADRYWGADIYTSLSISSKNIYITWDIEY